MKSLIHIFIEMFAFFVFILIVIVFVFCRHYSINQITSPFFEDIYYIQIKSKDYDLDTLEDKGQILLKNEEIANITYVTRSYANKNIKNLKKSKNIAILNEVYSDKNNGYCFFKNEDTNTYYYLLVYPHSAALIQSNISKKETQKMLQKISIVECNQANDNVIPIIFE